MKYFIKTYGCQMNVADSNAIAAHLESLGMKPADKESEAGVIVLNTCTVRLDTENRALAYIGRLSELKEQNQGLKIIVAGCAAQRLGEGLKKRFPAIDIVVGAREAGNFAEIYNKAFGGQSISAENNYTHVEPRAKESPAAAFVTIMKGCGNYCSYCIVPNVRGPEISRPAGEIIDEIKSAVAAGLKEVVLLGQNVNSYRGQAQKAGSELDFPALLEEINNIDGLKRIRFITSHPKDLSTKLIDCFGRLEKLCEHIHLPLQSGSDKILKSMNRKYTAEGYCSLVERIRAGAPGISITSDILTGFPGEAEEDFQMTLDMIERCDFNSVFAYKYSPREGTVAFDMAETVSNEEKERRYLKIKALAGKISAANHLEFLNSTQNTLVERTEKGVCTGRTRTNLKVFFKAPKNLQLNNRLADVIITKTKINTLEGVYVG